MVTIQGIRSFVNQEEVQPFSKGYNVLLGSNGGGKTSVLLALQLILSDEYSELSTNAKMDILHGDVNGVKVESASVTVIFDNTARRIPINRNEVKISRTVGPGKDLHFIDGVECTRQEVNHLLKQGGLPIHNNFFIIKQDQMTALALTSDSTRLSLFWKIANDEYEELRYSQQFINSNGLENASLAELSEGEKELQELRMVHTNFISVFQRINRDFKRIFAFFEPNCEAFLYLKARGRRLSINEFHDDTELVSLVRGIGIQASFTPGGLILPLSFGQEFLVAVTLVFAIQKLRTSPIYLLDEIDQMLDPHIRGKVAAYLNYMSKKYQLIVSASRPEQLRHATAYYEVMCPESSSRMTRVTKIQAQMLVDRELC